MNYIKLFENFEEEEEKKTIDDYPMSVRSIYKRFNQTARESINDNLERFAKMSKRVFYNKNKDWREYFKDKKVKNLNTLTEVMKSLENWIK